MFDQDNILKSPRGVAQDPNANEPLRLVLEDPHQARLTKLRIVSWACFALVLLSGAVIYGWALFGRHQNDPGFWHVAWFRCCSGSASRRA